MKYIVYGWLVLIGSMNAYALRVELQNDTFSTTGRHSNQNLFITNNRDDMIALEVYIQSRTIDEHSGVDILTDSESFLVYPNQLLLHPNEQQVVTLTWVGDSTIASEQAYRIIVEELNLALGDASSNDAQIRVKVSALTKVIKAAYVTPEKAKANIVVSNVTNIDSEGSYLGVTLTNQGARHALIKETKITIVPLDASGQQIIDAAETFIPDVLRGSINMLANSHRTFSIELPPSLREGYEAFDVSI